MEKRRYLLPYLITVFLALISRPALGNMTVEPEWYEAPAFILPLVFLVGPFIESFIVVLFLSRKEKIRIFVSLFVFYFIINLITVPATQIFVGLLYYEFRTNLFIIAELLPLFVEFSALLMFFKYYRKKKQLRKKYPKKYIFLMALISNLVTIVIGVILFFIFL
jgi:uncharacterized membrane protein YidH (DUF202 family)